MGRGSPGLRIVSKDWGGWQEHARVWPTICARIFRTTRTAASHNIFRYPAEIVKELIQKYFQTLQQTQFLQPQQMVAYQRQQLEPLLRHARAHVPFYRESGRLDPIFSHDGTIDWDRWPEIPVLTRQDLQSSSEALKAEKIPKAHGEPVSQFPSRPLVQPGNRSKSFPPRSHEARHGRPCGCAIWIGTGSIQPSALPSSYLPMRIQRHLTRSIRLPAGAIRIGIARWLNSFRMASGSIFPICFQPRNSSPKSSSCARAIFICSQPRLSSLSRTTKISACGSSTSTQSLPTARRSATNSRRTSS